MPSYDTIVWLPNALILTALLLLATWFVWKRRGIRAGIRMFGVAMLPLALYWIGLWHLLWSIALRFSSFFSGFVFRPTVWLGCIMGVVAIALIVVPRRLSKALGSKATGGAKAQKPSKSAGKAPAKRSSSSGDDDMADVEAILKKHGIE
ncbi:MAG: hypothetical protein ACRDQA_32120 [Nocardioidaceae bacterium]